MKSIFLVTLIVAIFIQAGIVKKPGMILTLNGKPYATIIKPAVATPRENLAAEDLQRYIQKISGANLPIKMDNEPVKGNLILIGGPERNKKTAELISQDQFDALVPGPEGMMIKTFGNDKLVLAGSSKNTFEYERGTLYAVYEFLEANLGCSFAAYGQSGTGMGEYVPVNRSVSIAAVNYVQGKSDLPYRTAILHYSRPDTKPIPIDHTLTVPFMDWLIKNRYNRMLAMETVYEPLKSTGLLEEAKKRGLTFSVGHHESSFLFLPPDGNKYFSEAYHITHPEYYKLQDDGMRYYSKNIWGGQWIFCSRNQGAINEVAGNINKWLTKNPYVDMVCLWPNDGAGEHCICPDCAPHSKTANYVYFANEVVKIVSKEHSSAKIDLLTYGDLWPYTGIELHPSLLVDQANWNSTGMRAHGKNDGTSLIGTSYMDNAKNWSAHGAKMVHYDYYMGSFGWHQLYYPMADEIDDIYTHMKSTGYAQGSGTQIECYNMWNFVFNFYMFGRTSYNTSMKMADNLDRFGQIFGAGAPHIRSYLEYAEGFYEGQIRMDSKLWPGKWFAQNVDRNKVYEFFEKAFNAEPEGRLRDNIRMLRMAFRYTDLYVNGGNDGEMKYMHDHFDSYGSGKGYGIAILKEGSGSFTPDKWYKMSSTR